MLYTRKGDRGTTSDFSKNSGRKSKSSYQTEALGALDEINSFLGLVKIKSENLKWKLNKKRIADIVEWSQHGLFSVQAEVAGAPVKIDGERIIQMEEWIDGIEKILPPIKTFFVSGGTELAAMFDVSRTLVRKAERRVIAGHERKEYRVGENTLAYLNRLSSLFYALARLSNHKSGIKEQPPTYK